MVLLSLAPYSKVCYRVCNKRNAFIAIASSVDQNQRTRLDLVSSRMVPVGNSVDVLALEASAEAPLPVRRPSCSPLKTLAAVESVESEVGVERHQLIQQNELRV